MGRDGAGCPLPDGPGCPLGLDREHAGLNWAAALVSLVSEMSSLTPGTWLLLVPSLVAQMVENLPALWDLGSIPGLGRSPGEGNGNPLQ